MYPYNVNNNQKQAPQVNIKTRENANALYQLSKDKQLLALLATAIADTEELAPLYEQLSRYSELGKDSEVLRSAFLDELKHNKQLSDIYYQITGERLQKGGKNTASRPKLPTALAEGLESMLLDELENTDFYRDLMLLMPQGDLRDQFFEVVTDKQDHCCRLCYLYSKYK